jgi:hypothetical protein
LSWARRGTLILRLMLGWFGGNGFSGTDYFAARGNAALLAFDRAARNFEV